MPKPTSFLDPGEWRLQTFAAQYLAIARCVLAGPIRGWVRFERHVRADQQFRLLRVGLSQEPGALEFFERTLAQAREDLRRIHLFPPLHIYCRDGRPSAQVVLSVGQAGVVFDGDGAACFPLTILLRTQLAWDRRAAVATLNVLKPTDPDEAAARDLLLDALLGHTKDGIG